MRKMMLVLPVAMVAMAICLLPNLAKADEDGPSGWAQWGQNSQHHGFVGTVGQDATSILADKIYDPFVKDEEDDAGGTLLVHYQVPLLEGNNVWMEFKTGRFIACVPAGSGIPPPGETDCGASAWNTQTWQEKRLHWEDGNLVEKWTFTSDWKAVRVELAQWEPVFHAALAGDFIYVPGFGGSVFKLDKEDGTNLGRIKPFGATLDPNTFVAGPISADRNGNIYYNAIKFTDQTPGAYPGLDNSWLVKVASNGTVSKVSYPTLLAGIAPAATDPCERAFSNATLPWPPSPTSSPRTGACGAQRPGLNIAPAIGSDGTIYTASKGHGDLTLFGAAGDRASFVVAVHPNLTLKWASSLAHTLNDGCGGTVPIASSATPEKGKCRHGANSGVDPSTNRRGSGRVLDAGTSSPVVLPDGNILFGAYTRYNIARGHSYKLRGSNGSILATYDFGWDDTPAVFQHDDSYSIVMKDNHYDEESGFYCNPSGGVSNIVCAFTGIPAGPFYITQLSPNLVPQWKFRGIENRVCHRDAGGTVTCVNDGSHPNGFEWCINAPAIDGDGNVYVASEDGNIYVLEQGHSGGQVFTTPKFKLFTNLAVGAAYTPFSIDSGGKLYAQNNGHLFVIGEGGDDVRHNDEGGGGRRSPPDRDDRGD